MAKLRAATAIKQAVFRDVTGRKQAMLDRLFAVWFARFVYNQIWEDPEVDLEALQIRPDSRVVTIASGGCNVMNYLVADPAGIVAVDLNPAHVALTRLKLSAMRHLPDYETFFRFFGIAKDRDNVDAYFSHVAPHLDADTRRFWEHRSLLGRQRIEFFAKGLYRKALLGRFIGFLHAFAKMAGQDVSRLMDARSLEEQREIYRSEIEPLFEKKLVRLLARQPILLYSLGIPPNQFDSMRGDAEGDLASLCQDRIRRLACDFDLSENYFAWQAFGRHYDVEKRRAAPPYLQPAHFDTVRGRIDRVETRCISMTDYLASQPAESHDRYVLLDSVDWMDQRLMGALWAEIRRTSRPGSRVIFRTAGARSVFETLLPQEALEGWTYHADESQRFLQQDRSAIYGGFHLYSRG
jgi:S-adenosylmethionine-diacylglycerol 3-amino-3-carboxypropyl transferase